MLVENVNFRLGADTPNSVVAQSGAKPIPRPAAARVESATSQDKEAQPKRGENRDAPAPGEPKSRSRLAFDEELSRVFIEIVDRSSGEVVHRYPPEEIVRHIEALIEQQHLRADQGETGFLVDQSA